MGDVNAEGEERFSSQWALREEAVLASLGMTVAFGFI
jgi:hypothetical protein